jgi:hypothetical protein
MTTSYRIFRKIPKNKGNIELTKIVILTEVTEVIRGDGQSHPPIHLERRLTLYFA